MQNNGSLTAAETRKIDFATIDAQMNELGARINALRTKCAAMSASSWKYTGRGAELDDLKARLAGCLEIV